MTKDPKNYKRLAEIWEANAAFYLKEIERANWLYTELLKQQDKLQMNNRKLLKLVAASDKLIMAFVRLGEGNETFPALKSEWDEFVQATNEANNALGQHHMRQ